MTVSLIAVPLLLAAAPISVDKAAHSVTFTAHATEIEKGTTVEFAFVGPGSDRTYEAMFVTDVDAVRIVRAFEEAGIPSGKAVSPAACRFWPAGKDVTIEPSIWAFIDDKQTAHDQPICYTGGSRDRGGLPEANTNMPAAILALYRLDQSLMLFGDAVDQSAVYGRFTSNGKAVKGKRYTFKVSWDGKSGTTEKVAAVEPGKLRKSIETLRGEKGNLDVLPAFSPRLTAAEARAAASALAVLDSPTIRVNGFSEGQIFYRGFLPDEKWRDRSKRLTQPLEVHVGETNLVCTLIDEDWNVEGTDPKLTPHDEAWDVACRKFKGDTCLFYVRADERLERIYALKRKLPKAIRNWYVFID